MNRKAIAAIRFLSTVIMTIAAVVSYQTQRQLLLGWKVDELSSYAIPVTVDLLAIICTLGAHTPGVNPVGRRIAYRVLAVAGAASLGANFAAGVTWGSRIAHGWTVVAYLLAELVAAKVKADKAGTAVTAVPATTSQRPVVAATVSETEPVVSPTETTAVPTPVVAEGYGDYPHPGGEKGVSQIDTPLERPAWLAPIVPVSPAPMRRTATSPLTGRTLATTRRR